MFCANTSLVVNSLYSPLYTLLATIDPPPPSTPPENQVISHNPPSPPHPQANDWSFNNLHALSKNLTSV